MAPRTMQQLYDGPHRLSFRAGTYLALVRMMALGHLVPALYGHTQLASQTQQRLARTRQTLLELIVHGLDSVPGRAAVQRLRSVHARLQADPADFRYVLGAFFLEPLRWNAAHGRTRLTDDEAAQLLAFWLEVGRAMGLADLPVTLQAWRHEQATYEAAHRRRTPEGVTLARLCLRDVVKLTVPAGLRVPFRQLMLATMEPQVREMLDLPPPHPLTRLALPWLLRAEGLMAARTARSRHADLAGGGGAGSPGRVAEGQRAD